MKNEMQNLSDNSGKDEKDKKYDIFISYRHLSSDSKIHSASLARSIAQAFQLEGFKVFFYCNNTKDAFDIIENVKSRYFIILVTQYSIDTVENYHYKAVEEKESTNVGKEGDGYNYAKELYLIDKGIASGKIDKGDVFLFNIDKCFERRRDIPKAFSEYGYKYLGSYEPQRTEVINFPTDEDFSIDKLINPDPDKENKTKIKKSPRFSYQRYKESYEINQRSYDSFRRTCRFVLILLSCLLLGTLAALLIQHNELSRFRRESIVFAGGGTVQRYIDSVYRDSGVNIKHYKWSPGSKYIHLPSTTAWQLLWDDINEGSPRQYCPIVLSAGRIDTKGVDIEKFKRTRRIAEYQIDSIPLMVQIFDGLNRKGLITLDSLKEKLKGTSKYEIWTTTKESGTYLEYKALLDDSVFNIENIVNCQSGGWKCFNTNGPIGDPDPNKKQIYLANKHYYNINNGKDMSEYLIISDTMTRKIKTEKLYVYTIAFKKENGESSELELLPAAEKFLYSIGCNTAEKRTTNNYDKTDPTGAIVRWNKRK